MLLPFGTIYLSGARTPRLDRIARANLLEANSFDEAMPIGIIVQPLTARYLDNGADHYQWVGIDNGCFTEIGQQRFNIDNYLRMIDRALNQFGEDHVLFATAQDVAFNWEATLEKSLPTLPLIRRTGAPAALVVQDGAEIGNIPWGDLDCIFVGGSTEWKISETAAGICREAVRRHKWTHMGRVNSLTRMRIAQRNYCRSADGTYLLHEAKKGNGAAAVDTILEWARDSWKNDPARASFGQSTFLAQARENPMNSPYLIPGTLAIGGTVATLVGASMADATQTGASSNIDAAGPGLAVSAVGAVVSGAGVGALIGELVAHKPVVGGVIGGILGIPAWVAIAVAANGGRVG